jgi:hypothetical protein
MWRLNDGLQDMAGTDGRVGAISVCRRAKPGVLKDDGQLWRKAGAPAQVTRCVVDGPHQRIPHGIDVQFVVVHDGRDIAVPGLDQLEQPVLDRNLVREPCVAQACCGLERFRAVWIKPLQKLAGVAEGSVSVVVHGHVRAIRTSEEGACQPGAAAARKKKPVRTGGLAKGGR